MLNIKKMCESAPMVPVLTIDEIASAVPLAQALVAGGIHVLEITLRTDSALAAIEAVRAACPDAVVGAGTLQCRGRQSLRQFGCAVRCQPGGAGTFDGCGRFSRFRVSSRMRQCNRSDASGRSGV